MKRVIDAVEKVVEVLVAFMVLGILVATLAQVVSRYVFNSPFMWTEELARALGIWLVLLCSGIVVRENRHLGFDILPKKWEPVFYFTTNLAIVFFAVALFSGSIKFVMVGQGMESSALHIPLWILYLSIPAGLVLMALFAIENIKSSIASFFSKNNGEFKQ